MLLLASQVGQSHYYVGHGGRIFTQSAEQLSHVTERESLVQEAVRESQDPRRDVGYVSDEPELPRQPSQTSGQENNVAPVSQPDFSMPDPGPPETPDETAETSDHVRENTAEPIPHSSSSHWEWRPEYEVPPPEPGDPVVTRRRIVAKRPPLRLVMRRKNPTETIEIGACARIVPTDRRGIVCRRLRSPDRFVRVTWFRTL